MRQRQWYPLALPAASPPEREVAAKPHGTDGQTPEWGAQMLAQAAQRCGGASSIRDSQNPTGYGPGHPGKPGAGDPAMSRGLDWVISSTTLCIPEAAEK